MVYVCIYSQSDFCTIHYVALNWIEMPLEIVTILLSMVLVQRENNFLAKSWWWNLHHVGHESFVSTIWLSIPLSYKTAISRFNKLFLKKVHSFLASPIHFFSSLFPSGQTKSFDGYEMVSFIARHMCKCLSINQLHTMSSLYSSLTKMV